MARSYAVEAGWLGVENFFPLRRTAQHIAQAKAVFVGAHLGADLVGVVEVEAEPDQPVNLAALVVERTCFRRGIGMALVEHVLASYPGSVITVSTGIKNLPARRLYARAGFVERVEWTTPDGIPMVTLRRDGSSRRP